MALRQIQQAAVLMALWGAIAASAVRAAEPAGARLVLLEGAAIDAASLEIAGGKLRGEGVPAGLMLDDLRSIERQHRPAADAPAGATLVELPGDSRIFARRLTIANDKCQIAWNGGEPLSLAIDVLRAIHFDATESAEFEKALAAPSAEFDRLFLKDGEGRPIAVNGLIDALDGEQMAFSAEGKERRLPIKQIAGVVLARPAAAAPSPPHVLVEFRNGSRLGGQTLELADQQGTLALPVGGRVAFGWSAVARVKIRSRRVAFLSDLKPVAEKQQPIVTLPLAAQRDRSVVGKPLMVGSREYEKGLGVHARSELTFETDKKWDRFAATIGLDSNSGTKGDCVFAVLADGEVMLRRRLRGTDEPAPIEIPITGHERITLLVEPGEDLDLGDHANWCDARFVAKPRR